MPKVRDLSKVHSAKLKPAKYYIGKPEFLTDAGGLVEHQWTIQRVLGVEQDWHGDDDEPDLVIEFAEPKKNKWIVNKTNKLRIEAIYGQGLPQDLWIGKTLTLFFTETEPGTRKKIRNPQGGHGGVRVKGN